MKDVFNLLRRPRVMAAGAFAAFAAILIIALLLPHAEEIKQSLATISMKAIILVTLMLVPALVFRAEVWQISLRAAGGGVDRRSSYPLFLVSLALNQVSVYLGSAVRIAGLGRLDGRAPQMSSLAAIELSTIVIEALITSVLVLLGASTLGIPMIWAIAVTVGAVATALIFIHARHRFAHRRFSEGLNMLTQAHARFRVTALLVACFLIQITRLWLILDLVGLEPTFLQATLAFVAIGLVGMLPFGPASGPAALLAVFGHQGVAAAGAAGVVYFTSGLAGSAVVALLAGLYIRRHESARVTSDDASEPEQVTKPRTTVVVPCFNDGAFIEEMVSLLDEPEPIEMIVVDDGSTEPASISALEKLDAANAWLTVIWQQNAGPAAACRRGAAAAKTDYVFPFGADDIIAPGALSELANALDDNPQVDFVYGDFISFGRSERYMSSFDWDPWLMTQGNYCAAMLLIRRDVYCRIGGHPTRSQFEDWDFTMALAERGCNGLRLPRVTFFYRVHPRGTGRRWESSRRRWASEYELLKSAHPDLFDRIDELEASSSLRPPRRRAFKLLRWSRQHLPAFLINPVISLSLRAASAPRRRKLKAELDELAKRRVPLQRPA